MDPNATLRELRRLAEIVANHIGQVNSRDAQELAEHFQALDVWLLSGGFLPQSWHKEKVGVVYSLAEIKNGTGWDRHVKFREVRDNE